MLRRILVPFSELFIMLTLMFFVLFFISASLGGRGDALPEDDLHIVTVAWETKFDVTERTNRTLGDQGLNETHYNVNFLRNAFSLNSPLQLNAITLADWREESDWDISIFDGGRLVLNNQRFTKNSDGQCVSVASRKLGDRTTGFRVFREDQTLRPEELIRNLAVANDSTDFTVATSGSSSVGRDVVGPYEFFISNKLSLSFLPEDVHRPTLIQILVWGAPIDGEGEAPEIGKIRYSLETIGSKSITSGTLEFKDNFARAVWTSLNDQVQESPILYINETCTLASAISLYVLVTSDGATFSVNPPKVGS